MKQVILCRTDLRIGKGKLCAQVAHASLEAALRLMKKDKEKFERWKREGAKKVVLKVKDLEELLHYVKLAEKEGVVTAIIADAGKTQVEPGTVICAAIGPDEDEKIDKITGKLKLL